MGEVKRPRRTGSTGANRYIPAHPPVYVAALAIHFALEDLRRDPQRASHRSHRLPLILHLGQAEVAHLRIRAPTRAGSVDDQLLREKCPTLARLPWNTSCGRQKCSGS